MTNQEFRTHFDISYNAIASMSAPGIDDFELSVYLTTAQLEIIKNYYDPLSNRKQKGFEATEKRRRDLNQLLKDYKTTSTITNSSNIDSEAKFYIVPNDLFLIVNEKAKVTSEDCYNNKILNIKPKSYDEYDTQIDNPFEKPNEKVAWRLDLSNVNNNKVVEIISPYNISGSLEYQIRYIKYPKPIIITNLNTAFPSDNLTIDGIFAETPCELNTEICREILDRAVLLATTDYRPQNLQVKAQVSQTNE
jgi:hypothetical protein